MSTATNTELVLQITSGRRDSDYLVGYLLGALRFIADGATFETPAEYARKHLEALALPPAQNHQARHIENALFPDAESNDLSAIAAERERIATAAEEMADDLDWDGFMGDLVSSRDHAKSLLHRVAAIARGES